MRSQRQKILTTAGAAVVVVLAALVLRREVASMGRVAAQREPAAQIAPVVISGIEYRAPNNQESEGTVEAWNITTGRLLWKRRVYATFKLPSLLLERDAQCNFIRTLTPGPGKGDLTVVDEKNRHYVLNLTTRSVKRTQ
jgi:hypothetical protein